MEEQKTRKLRIVIAPKGNMAKAKVIAVDSDVTLDSLLTIAKQKLKGKWNLCTLKDGSVVPDDAALKSVLHNDLVLVFAAAAQTEGKEEAVAKPLPHELTKEELDGKIRVLAKKSLLEEESVMQLRNCAKLEGVRLAVGLPDLHPGKGFPIGSAVISDKLIYPHLVGEDIGCGMSLVRTGIPVSKQKPEKWHKQLEGIEMRSGPALETYASVEPFEWPKGRAIPPLKDLDDQFLQRFGTVGRGNHFAEIQEVDKVVDPALFKELGMDQNELYLLIHSGSRNFGESIYVEYTKKHGIAPFAPGTPEIADYMQKHDRAVAYARRSRAIVAYRILSQIANVDQTWLSAGNSCVVDVCHNFVEQLPDGGFVHRKGATPTKGAVVIPG